MGYKNSNEDKHTTRTVPVQDKREIEMDTAGEMSVLAAIFWIAAEKVQGAMIAVAEAAGTIAGHIEVAVHRIDEVVYNTFYRQD